MRRFVITLVALLSFVPETRAQSFMQHLQQDVKGKGSVTVTRVWSEVFSVRAISFFQWQGEKILRLEEYWSDDGAPPEWRQKMQIGQKITED